MSNGITSGIAKEVLRGSSGKRVAGCWQTNPERILFKEQEKFKLRIR